MRVRVVVEMFKDRQDGGRQLAERLTRYRGAANAIVLGIPRGGVVVAAEVAHTLALPLDVAVAAKVGSPGNPEYAVGAVTPDGQVSVNASAGLTHEEVGRIADSARDKARRYSELLRDKRLPLDVRDKTVLLVDDGLATGLTARAAVQWLKREGAQRVVVAVPVAAPDAVDSLSAIADEVVAVSIPIGFYAVGQFYERFTQTQDQEVLDLLFEGSYGRMPR